MYIKNIKIKKENTDINEYPYSLPIIKNLSELPLKKPVTFLAGDNGAGKSTLIEAVAKAFGFNSEGGSRNFIFSTNETTSDLDENIVLTKTTKRPKDGYFFRAESFYNLAGNIDEIAGLNSAYGGKSLHEQSHGESFLSLMQNRFFGNGLYILDEPESALSIEGQMAMIGIIDRLVKNNSQLIISTHSPIIMSYPGAAIYEIVEDNIIETNYEDTKNYSLAKYFLENYEKMLEILLD